MDPALDTHFKFPPVTVSHGRPESWLHLSSCTSSTALVSPGHRAIAENSLNYRQSDAIISTFSDVTNIPCSTLRRQLKAHSFPIIKCNPVLLAQILDILTIHPKMARAEMILEQWMKQGTPGSDMIDLIGAELAYAKIMSKGSDFETPLEQVYLI